MKFFVLIPLLLLISSSEGRFLEKSFKVSEGWETLFFGGFLNPKTNLTTPVSSVNPNIIGGTNASPGEFPWQVSVQLIDGGSRYHVCGGSILSSTKIATAAHCCTGDASNFVVVAGAHDVRANEATQQAAAVTRMVKHSSYNANSYNYDACKLFLKTPLTLNARVAVIKPCTADISSGTCTTSGWGTTSSSSTVFPPQLQKVTLSVIPRATCASNYSGTNTITTAMMCAGGTAGKGGCNGDSGGPIVCNGCLAGATSWGKEPCGQANFPTVYTNAAESSINTFYTSN